MYRLVGTLVAAIGVLGLLATAQDDLTIAFVRGEETVQIRLTDFEEVSGTVAYQGPVMDDGGENWKAAHAYTGVPVRTLVDAAGGLSEGETLGVVAVDGWYKVLPYSVLYDETPAGQPILATSRDDDTAWDNAPTLIFLPDDEALSNGDMLTALGPDLAHYFGDSPSTTGLMVKGVAYLVVDYDGSPLPLPWEEEAAEEETAAAEGILLTVSKGEAAYEYTIADLEAMDVVTAEGTFTNSASVDYTASYTGVPLMTLVGNIPSDSTIRVTASDGYSMNYPAEMLFDTTEGTWILAFKENGEWMPTDPGPLRIVQVGESNPHFTSSLSAKMVAAIEVLGTYEEYSLLMTGAVERLFARGELEAGVGCPCHTATVSVTSKGETHTFTGLPLWRLVAYVDDDVFPAAEDGIHYNDEDFNDVLAETAYEISLTASDGYTQTVTADLIARDDRFIVAFKMDGVFLDPASSGYMRFVYDDAVELPDGMKLRSVKFLESITLDL
jgi:DMSO/TMAO reductase YedYZ molybdopterin-dependent catalytic subunit